MFWFLVAITILIIWLGERSDLKKKISQSYNQGTQDGRRALKEQLRAIIKKGNGATHELHAIIDEPDEGASIMPVQQEAQSVVAEQAQAVDATADTTYVYSEELQPAFTQEEIEAEKARRTVSNLNALLYVGSFLIVAAAALFVNLTMPAFVKLLALVIVTGAFYAAGLIVYAKSERLRPAATAFVGTGLAILPFVGFALKSLGGLSNESAWFITSVVGLFAYGLAAVRLRSQLVSYITMAFVVSLALSSVSVLSLAVIWYFIVLIGISLLYNSIHYLWPRSLPAIFWVPLSQTAKITTPLTLVASLLVFNRMDLFMYEVLFGIATLHYIVVWLEARRVAYELVVRGLAHFSLLLFAYDMAQRIGGNNGVIAFGVVWLVLALVQVLYSYVRVVREEPKSVRRESICAGIGIGLMIMIVPLWLAVSEPSRWVAGNLTLAGAAALAVAFRLRRAAWAYITLIVSVLVVLVVAKGVIQPDVSAEGIALTYAVLGAIGLFGLERATTLYRSRSVQMLLAAATITYASCVALMGFTAGNSATLGWTMLIAAGLMIAVSYLLRSVAVEIVGAVLGVISVAGWVDVLLVDNRWQLLATVVMAGILLVVGAALHHKYNEQNRRDGLVTLGAIVGAGLVFVLDANDSAVLRTATLILLVVGVAMLGLRIALAQRNSRLGVVALCSYVGYPLLALIVATNAGEGWAVLVLFVLTAMLWISSYIEKQALVLLAGNVALLVGLHTLWSWLMFSSEWRVYGITWIAAVVFYATYWFSRDRNDSLRQLLSLGSVLAVLGGATIVGIFESSSQWVLASAGSLLAAAGVVAMHGYLEKKDNYIEAAIYVGTLALQCMVAVLLPEVNVVVYGHWWALTIGLVAVWRKDFFTRMIVALSFITVPTGLFALTGKEGYSLVFLIEHIVVAMAGAILRKQWAMWWGIGAVIVAILYFLRNYTVVALLFLGFLLILFVIWRLMKSGKKE